VANSIGLRWRFEPASGGEFAGPRSQAFDLNFCLEPKVRDVSGSLIPDKVLLKYDFVQTVW
jgi:hypothetical protein